MTATTDVVTGGAVVVGIIAILLALRPYLLHKKNHTPSPAVAVGRDSAGTQNVEFWEKRFDAIDGAVATLDRIVREHRGLTASEIDELRDLLVDIDTNIKVAIATRPPIRNSREREDR